MHCFVSLPPTGKSLGTVEVVEHDWGTDAHHLFSAGRNHGDVPAGYDVVMCADCVYARASVEPLLESLCQVWWAKRAPLSVETAQNSSVVRLFFIDH